MISSIGSMLLSSIHLLDHLFPFLSSFIYFSWLFYLFSFPFHSLPLLAVLKAPPSSVCCAHCLCLIYLSSLCSAPPLIAMGFRQASGLGSIGRESDLCCLLVFPLPLVMAVHSMASRPGNTMDGVSLANNAMGSTLRTPRDRRPPAAIAGRD